MTSSKLLVLLSMALFACGSSSSSDSADDPVGEDELKASECPLAVDVLVQKPSIAPDGALKSSWANDMKDYESDPKKAAADQLTLLAPHVAMARAEGAVELHGTRNRGCFYATVDAKSGK